MTKDDWIKLAMPASITLLAAAIFTMPFVVQAAEAVTTIVGPEISVWKTDLQNPILVKIVD